MGTYLFMLFLVVNVLALRSFCKELWSDKSSFTKVAEGQAPLL
jgi:hypothetical protein